MRYRVLFAGFLGATALGLATTTAPAVREALIGRRPTAPSSTLGPVAEAGLAAASELITPPRPVAPPAASPRPVPRKPRRVVKARPAATPRPVAKSRLQVKPRPVAKRPPPTRQPQRPAPAVEYRYVKSAGVPMHVVRIDIRRPGVRLGIATPGQGIGSRDTWSKMIGRTHPVAAITGTYFCTQSGIPVGDIHVGGKRLHVGGVGTGFAFAPGKGAKIVECRTGIREDWTGFDTALRAGPRLLTRGKRTLWPQGEGFRDPAITAKNERSALAITRDGQLLLVAVQKPVLLRTLAAALKGLGAVDAMCLDGGSSTGLYHHGKTVVKPERSLTNLLVVYDSKARYEQNAGVLNPTVPPVLIAQKTPGAG